MNKEVKKEPKTAYVIQSHDKATGNTRIIGVTFVPFNVTEIADNYAQMRCDLIEERNVDEKSNLGKEALKREKESKEIVRNLTSAIDVNMVDLCRGPYTDQGSISINTPLYDIIITAYPVYD